MEWIMREQPFIELSTEQIYDVPTCSIVNRMSDLTPCAFRDIRRQEFIIDENGMFCMWMTVRDQQHAFYLQVPTILWSLSPYLIFHVYTGPLGRMKHLVLSAPPPLPLPCEMVSPRHYMDDKKKASAFLLCSNLPDDLNSLIIQHFYA